MKKIALFTFTLLIFSYSLFAKTMFVSPGGNNTDPGTLSQPYKTIQKAIDLVKPGDTIFIRGGFYALDSTIRIKGNKTGTSKARIYLWAYPGERVVIDGSKIPHSNETTFKMDRCIYVNHEGNYWHFKGLELCNAKDNGMKLEGSYNIVENCKFYKNNDTGLQIGMYKDFSIEETKSLPAGEPEFNPGYRYCRGNIVINCDSWFNNDKVTYSGSSDDGGDADGFACKLFPGPGTEFHGCRGWCNSDDDWDLYMVYHPVVINHCMAWKAGYDSTGTERGNGNGFKLGGGGSSGGAAFDQSVGAHLVRNCVSFENLNKGFDQNNAYEAMYLFNNVAWGNDYNYRFPTIFEYGTMYMRNNIGWGAINKNHEFLSADKDGSKVPDTDYNSWTTIDGCDAYKEGNKVNGKTVNTKDHSAQFRSLSSSLFLAPRLPNGSLPDNDLARLVSGSYFIDKGQIIQNFELTPHIPVAQQPAGYEQLPNLSIGYNDVSADMGAFETGLATYATLSLIKGTLNQTVHRGSAMAPVVISWGDAATGVVITGLPAGVVFEKDSVNRQVTISGNPTETSNFKAASVGGVQEVFLSGTITVSDLDKATLTCVTDNATQTVFIDYQIEPVIFVKSGKSTTFEVTGLPAGLTYSISGDSLFLKGIPSESGTYMIKVLGGMDTVSISGTFNLTLATRVLTGGWYTIQDAFDSIPEDLKGRITLYNGSDAYPTVWNPAYVESDGNAPSGCTKGAINVERGGSVSWDLPSLAEFKANIHFTGGRTIEISWTQNGNTSTWNSGSLSKGTFTSYDLMSNAGIAQTQSPITVKFKNLGTSGGIRIYDFLIRVYDIKTAIQSVESKDLDLYQTETAVIVYGDIANLSVYSIRGRVVAQSVNSQVVDIQSLPAGVYIVRIQDKSGRIMCKKFILK
jgi:hypothetical protein